MLPKGRENGSEDGRLKDLEQLDGYKLTFKLEKGWPTSLKIGTVDLCVNRGRLGQLQLINSSCN